MIGKLLGHTQAATTMRYAHLQVDPLREVTERVRAIIEGAGKAGAEVVKLREGEALERTIIVGVQQIPRRYNARLNGLGLTKGLGRYIKDLAGVVVPLACFVIVPCGVVISSFVRQMMLNGSRILHGEALSGRLASVVGTLKLSGWL